MCGLRIFIVILAGAPAFTCFGAFPSQTCGGSVAVSEAISSDLSLGYVRQQLTDEHQKILFLSDGQFPDKSREVANAFPEKLVVATDIEKFENWFIQQYYRPKPKNYSLVRADDNSGLPFRNDIFDAVFLDKGICDCYFRAGTFCAGIGLTMTSMRGFLSEVIRVLNKNNPQAFALLHGKHLKPGVVSMWKQAFEQTGEFKDFSMVVILNSQNKPQALRITKK